MASSWLDIKQWYQNIITPDFDNPEARKRCGNFDLRDSDEIFSPVGRLEEPTREMRDICQRLNSSDLIISDIDRPSFWQRWFSSLQPGSIRTCSAALAATALGAGALALPYAFSLVGIGLGLLTMTLAAMVSALSLQILMVSARYTNCKSYAAVLELAVGSRIAASVLDLVVLANGVGALTCCLIFEGDFIPAVVASPPGAGHWGIVGQRLSRESAVVGAALAVWPLTLAADISALRYVSVAVPVVLLVTIVIVLWDAPALYDAVASSGGIVWWDFEPRRWLKALAIMSYAFTNHTNAVPAANSLKQPSVARIVKATVNATVLVWGLLAALGICGYMSWGAATQGDFLLNYPEGRIEIWACRVGLSLIVYFCMPVTLFPTARSAAQLLLQSHGHVSPLLQTLSASLILALCTFIATRIASVASVLGIVGGILASSLMFWFPAVIYRLLLWPTQPPVVRWGVLVMVVTLGACGWASVAAPYL